MQSEKCIILRSGYISRDKNQDFIEIGPSSFLETRGENRKQMFLPVGQTFVISIGVTLTDML